MPPDCQDAGSFLLPAIWDCLAPSLENPHSLLCWSLSLTHKDFPPPSPWLIPGSGLLHCFFYFSDLQIPPAILFASVTLSVNAGSHCHWQGRGAGWWHMPSSPWVMTCRNNMGQKALSDLQHVIDTLSVARSITNATLPPRHARCGRPGVDLLMSISKPP